MTNGLTKTSASEVIPAVPAIPALPAVAEQWFLTPPPPGFYYVFANGEWQLKKSVAPSPPGGSGWSSGGSSGSYTIPAGGGGVQYKPGDTVTFGFAPTTGQTPTQYRSSVVGENGVVPPEIDGLALVTITITPSTGGSVGSSPGGLLLSKVPAGVIPISMQGRTYSNGFPADSGQAEGIFAVPNTAGGYTVVRRMYAPTGPNGMYVPVGDIQDPAFVTTQPLRTRAVRLANFPGAAGVPGVPGYAKFIDRIGWDAGANSIAELAGNVFVRFQVPSALGAKTGFFTGGSRASNDLDALFACFYCYSDATGRRWSIIDHGRNLVFANSIFTPDTVFEIQRAGTQIIYLVDGLFVYASPVASTGQLRVGTTLYRTGDFIL